jgi:hypothetical protein
VNIRCPKSIERYLRYRYEIPRRMTVQPFRPTDDFSSVQFTSHLGPTSFLSSGMVTSQGKQVNMSLCLINLNRKIRFVPCSKHACLGYKNQLLLYMEIVAVCSVNPTKHIHILCRHNVNFLNVIPGGT